MNKSSKSLLLLLLCALMCISPLLAAGGMSNFSSKNIYIEGQFTDVPKNEWFSPSVRTCFRSGLMSGLGGIHKNRFNPNGTLSVGEAISMAARVHNIYRSGPGVFPSTKPWYKSAVDYAISSKIITAAQFKNYDAKISRSDMVAVFSKALPISEQAVINNVTGIPDMKGTDANYDAILAFYRAGIVSGSGKTREFKPQSSIIRAEAAVIISNLAFPASRSRFTLTPDPVEPPVVPEVPPVVPSTEEMFTPFIDGLSLVKQDGKYRFTDTAMKTVIELSCTAAFPFSEGKAVTVDGSKLGCVNRAGTYTDLNYTLSVNESIEHGFSNGYLAINSISKELNSEYILLLNDKGEKLALPKSPSGGTLYTVGEMSSEGYVAAAERRSNGDLDLYYYDKQGNLVLELPKRASALRDGNGYLPISAGTFSCGMAVITYEQYANGKYVDTFDGAINIRGDMIIYPKYESLSDFSENVSLAYQESRGGYILISSDGSEKPLSEFDSVSAPVSGSPYMLAHSYGRYSFIDKSGYPKFSLPYGEVREFENGFAVVRDGKLYGFIDANGDIARICMYNEVSDVSSDGYAWVNQNGTWSIINLK